MRSRTEHFTTTTTDGWILPLRRVSTGPPTHDHPIVIVPGYGMSSFILGYHPTGISMEASFASRGFEVWSVDLRGQGQSSHPNGRPDYDMSDLALTDLPAVLSAVEQHTRCPQPRAHVIGCSLGGTILFVNLAFRASPQIHSAIAIGAPLRWVDIHPLVKLAFRPGVARLLPFKGNRRLAELVFPLALRVPRSLHIYMHPEHSDTSNYKMLLNTVSDTSRSLNVEIARWIGAVDLHVDGRDISDALRSADVPLLSIVANADGIVPRGAATSAHELWGHDVREVVSVGDARRRFAHADLFISRHSEELVFGPIADWCAHRSSA